MKTPNPLQTLADTISAGLLARDYSTITVTTWAAGTSQRVYLARGSKRKAAGYVELHDNGSTSMIQIDGSILKKDIASILSE